MKIPNIVWLLIFLAMIGIVAYFGFFKRKKGEGVFLQVCEQGGTLSTEQAKALAVTVKDTLDNNTFDLFNTVSYPVIKRVHDLSLADLCRVANSYLNEFGDSLRNRLIDETLFGETGTLQNKILANLAQIGL